MKFLNNIINGVVEFGRKVIKKDTSNRQNTTDASNSAMSGISESGNLIPPVMPIISTETVGQSAPVREVEDFKSTQPRQVSTQNFGDTSNDGQPALQNDSQMSSSFGMVGDISRTQHSESLGTQFSGASQIQQGGQPMVNSLNDYNQSQTFAQGNDMQMSTGPKPAFYQPTQDSQTIVQGENFQNPQFFGNQDVSSIGNTQNTNNFFTGGDNDFKTNGDNSTMNLGESTGMGFGLGLEAQPSENTNGKYVNVSPTNGEVSNTYSQVGSIDNGNISNRQSDQCNIDPFGIGMNR